MEEDKTVEDKYLFNDLFDEVIENIENEDETPERPLCDSLAELEKSYKDFQPLASGGMKRIFKVFDCKLNRYVAYARLHPNSPKELHDPFIREARLTSKLEHPNIISVHDIGIQEDDTPFFTMELKIGKTLAQILRDEPEICQPGTVSFNNALNNFVKVCDAISFAHSKNVLHLDIKPENIQIGGFGEVIVCDWGLGKIIGDKDIEYDQLLFNPDLLNNVTRADKIVGTPGYMAPEQIALGGEKTKQTDIYSLGATLYTILTGKAAFRGEVETVLKDTLSGQLTEPVDRNVDWQVPPGLNAVVMKAMALEPEKRYKSVEALKSEVQNYLNGRATKAEEAGLLKEAKLFYKRNRVSCNVALFFLMTILVIGTAFLINLAAEKKRAEQNFQQAELERTRVKDSLNRMYIEKDLATALLGDEFAKIRRSFELVDTHVFQDPLNSLKEAVENLKTFPETSRAYRWSEKQLDYIDLLQQNFHDFDMIFFDEEARNLLKEIIAKMARSKKPNEVTPIELFKQFIKLSCEVPYYRGTVVKMVKYDALIRESAQDHSLIVEVLLRDVNKNWSGNFTYDASPQLLKLSGQEFYRLSLEPKELFMRGSDLKKSVNLINSLPIKKLDISSTSVSHLWAITDLKLLEELIICDIKFRDLEPLNYMGKLKKLTVSKGYFSAEELSKVPPRIQVLEVE